MQKLTAVGYCRVSTTKQSQEGESLDMQAKICKEIAGAKKAVLLPQGDVWRESFSGRKDHRPVLDDLMAFIKSYIKKGGKIDYFIIRDIDRLTRQGSFSYEKIKREISAFGIKLVDSYGLIQPQINTLEHLGIEYEWSKYSPSEIAEKLKADVSRDEVRTILTRLIGREIELVREGYHIGAPSDGYLNKKVFVAGKKKNIQVPDPERAHFYQEMFTLRANTLLSDQEIVERINAMGYKTRTKNRWDKLHENIAGESGGKPIDLKQLQRVIQKPIYCGVICRKWTNYKPVRAKYKGLVIIDTFNKANKGKVFIKENADSSLEILYDYYPERIISRRNKDNPLFPDKTLVLCQFCGKPFVGSSPSGKSKKGFPTYHCARKHKYFGVNKKTFESNIDSLVNKLDFDEEFINIFEKKLYEVWGRRKKEITDNHLRMAENITNLEQEKTQLVSSWIKTENPVIKQELEKRIELVGKRIEDAQEVSEKTKISKNDFQAFIQFARYLMEHYRKLLMDRENIPRRRALFDLVFERTPDYQELINGTPELSLVFKLSQSYNNLERPFVDPRGVEPLTS